MDYLLSKEMGWKNHAFLLPCRVICTKNISSPMITISGLKMRFYHHVWIRIKIDSYKTATIGGFLVK